MSDQDLTSLEGIGEATAKILQSAGIKAIEALAAASYERLTAIGIGKKTAMKILTAARTWCNDRYGFTTGEEIIQQFETRQYLTSGSEGLNRILGGTGFQTQQVYELYGPPGSGKSNLLFQLVCTAFLPPERGGLGAGTVFIDTEETFALTRVQQVARRFGIDPDKLTRHILRSAPPTSDILIYVCERRLEEMVREVGARLICLDSIASLLRSEYGTAQERLPERQQKANLVIHALKRVAKATNSVAILTNQTTARPNAISRRRPWKHAMGHVVGHESQVRLMVRVKNNITGLREFEAEKGVELPPESCEAYLGALGFTDTPQKNPRRV